MGNLKDILLGSNRSTMDGIVLTGVRVLFSQYRVDNT